MSVPPFLESKRLREAGFRNAFSTITAGDAQARDRAVVEHVGAAQLWQATQVHGDAVVEAGLPADTPADALVASKRGDAVGVRVADCVPILLAADDGRVAAVHAGWRGVANGIIGKAAAMIRPRLAAVGPHIGPCCFEVGPEVAARIGFVDRVAGDRSYLDLRAAVHAQLRAAGVETIDDVGECTKCHPDAYHSFRRDAEASGRMIGVIVAR